MPRLDDTQRAAFVTWFDLVNYAARNGFTVTDTIAAASDLAGQAGQSVTPAENRAISTLYGYVRRDVNASAVFQAAAPNAFIEPSMMATAPYARDEAEMAAYPLYHVRFEYTYIDSAGNVQTEIKTSAQPLTIGPTVAQVTADVLDDAEAFANKYGHTLVSAVPISILAV